MKKIIKLSGIIALTVLVWFSLIGCGDGAGSGNGDLPIKTIKWEVGKDGFRQFYSNDIKNYDYYFYYLMENNNNTYEIDCKKMNGSQIYGYGMVFGASNTGTDNYYYLIITCDGYYRISKVSDGQRTTVCDWTETTAVKPGYNNLNNLKVVTSGTSYIVFINGIQVYNFTDEGVFGSRIGFYAAVGTEEYEDFPNRPVDVRFMKK